MNFKPTLIKTSISAIIGLAIGLKGGWQRIIIPTDVVWSFYWGPFILFFVVILLLVYLVWSLLEKKK